MTNFSIHRLPISSHHPGALILDRQSLRSYAPHVEVMLQELMAHLQQRGQARPMCPGVTVHTAYLLSVLEQHWKAEGIEPANVSTKTLVLYLPPAYQSVIGALAAMRPAVFNHPNLDLRGNTTYLGWTTTLAGEAFTTELWVPERPISDAINAACNERKSGWVPVVMLAGQSVAIGGFSVDDELICEVQATTSCKGNVEPEEVYEADELRRAQVQALEFGPTPWVYERWQEDGRAILAAKVCACTAK